MAIVRYRKPTNVVHTENLFDNFFRTGVFPHWEDELFSGVGMPSIDIKERKKDYLMTADLPGFTSRDIDIDLGNESLTIRGRTSSANAEDGIGWHRTSRSYQSFTRSFYLPGVFPDNAQVSAEMKNGRLEVTVPKQGRKLLKKLAVGNGGNGTMAVANKKPGLWERVKRFFRGRFKKARKIKVETS